MDDLARLAALGEGIFSSKQATSFGVTDKHLKAFVRAGTLVRLTRGWYAPADHLRGGEEHRHRLRSRAMLQRIGAGHVATHHSALLVYGLPTLTPDLGVVHVGSPTAKRTKRATGYVRHVLPRGTQVGEASTPTVAPAVATVQVGLLEGPMAALVAADRALRRGRPDLLAGPAQFGASTAAELAGAVTAYRRVPGIAGVARILRLTDPKSESVGETRLRYALALLAVPVESQFVVDAGGHGYRADFRVSGTRLLIEFDGLVKLDDPAEQRRADERERALRRQGWVFVRFTWPELDKLDLIAKRLAEAAATHGVPWPVAA